MGFPKFIGLWLWGALKRSIGLGDFLAGIAGNCITVILHFYPKYETAISDLIWQIPLYGLAAAIAFRLIVTPYEMWKNATEKYENLALKVGNSDLDGWKSMDEFTLYEAACLWVGKSPPASRSAELPDGAVPILSRLRRAILDEELKLKNPGMLGHFKLNDVGGRINGTPYEIDSGTEITRKSLVEYCRKQEEQPAFLFPSGVR